uniref:Uncharacterized protein n=1 Tax=Anopheles albimanus TaxID=7167 RepID=A0A182FG12_ANOAL
MPKTVAKKEEDSYDGNRSSVLKRKNPHPVRNLFKPYGETQQKCNFCGWVTRENATRMVKHIISLCKMVPDSTRRSMQNVVESNAERENRSMLSGHNKKDIHSYFRQCDNGKKRECKYCEWKTILNLTRMRNHLVMVCKEVPVSIRAQFLKLELAEPKEEPAETTQPEYESFRIVNVLEDGVRKDFEIISTDELPEEVDSLEVVHEDVDVDVANQDSTYYYEVNREDGYIIQELDGSEQHTANEGIMVEMADESCGAPESPTLRHKNDEHQQRQQHQQQEQQQRSTRANNVVMVSENSSEEDVDDDTIEDEKQQQHQQQQQQQLEYETERQLIENEAAEDTLLSLNCNNCFWCQKSLMENGGTAVMRDRKLYCSRACAMMKTAERRDSIKSMEPELSRILPSTSLSSSAVGPQETSTPIQPKSTDQQVATRGISLRKRILLGSKPILRQRVAAASRLSKPPAGIPASPEKRGNSGPLLRVRKVSIIEKDDAPKQQQQRQIKREPPPTPKVEKEATPIRSSTSSMVRTCLLSLYSLYHYSNI